MHGARRQWLGRRSRDTRRSTTAVPEKLANHCIESVSCSQTVIAHISNGTELYALQRAAAGALQTQHITTGWRRPVRATVRSDDTAAIGISSRSGAGKLKHLGVKEFRIQELVQARKLVIKKVGDDNLADVGTKYNEDGKKLVHLSSLSVLRMQKGLEMKALSGKVVLQGCASIVHVGKHSDRVNSPVIVRVSLEMVITVATGCLGFVAGGLVAAGPRAYSQG